MVEERLKILPLTTQTWDAYAGLFDRHNGVWGGCWCMVFHPSFPNENSVAVRRAAKKELVEKGEAHAALVFDNDSCIAWAQYGSCDELPRIRSRRAYDEGQDRTLPDWRITCFFVDKKYRREGISAIVLGGALDLIAKAGGGRVEAYPEELVGQKRSAGMLWGGTLGLFEAAGFQKLRKIGKHRWVVSKET